MSSPRIKRERKTIEVMTGMYCRMHHGRAVEGLCPECAAVNAYAQERMDKCPFINDKPTCKNCPVHCYTPQKREQVRVIMRYAGPRMLLSHPVLTFFHLIDGMKNKKK